MRINKVFVVEVVPETAFRLHAMLMRGLVRQENLGAVRKHEVGLTNSAYRPSGDQYELMAGLTELCAKVRGSIDPFESAFALLAGCAYLQAFADGNKRTGRLLCSIPLLKAGLPPISFIGVDRAAYGAGMVTWYELEEPGYLAEAVARGYELSAPSYIVAVATKRTPRSVEIRLRHRFDEELRNFMRHVVDGGGETAEDFAGAAFADLEDEDRDIIVASFVEVAAAINEFSAAAYGLPADIVEEYLRKVARGLKP